MKIDFEKMKDKLENIAKFCIKFALLGGVCLLPLSYIAYICFNRDKDNSQIENFSIATLLLFFILGLILSIFVWNYARRDKDDVDPDSSSFDNEDMEWIWSKNVPLWKRLCDIAIFGFLLLTGIIMGLGLYSLFVDDGGWTIAFVAVFSSIVTFTLLWLVKMIAKRGKQWYLFIVFYFLFDILSAFTFNYFHFYNNVSKTQRMENSIKYSQKLVEMVVTPISEEITRLDGISKIPKVALLTERNDSLKAWINNNEKIDGGTSHKYDEKGNITNSFTSKKDKYTPNQKKNFQKEWDTNDTELTNYYENSLGRNMESILQSEYSLCTKIQSKIRIFHNTETKKSVKRIYRDSIVNDINTLSGQLRQTPLAGISQDSISNMVEIIKLPEVSRLESIESLFNAINFSSNKTDIQKSENRLVYMSVTLSILIDLLPMLLGLFVAISARKNNDNTMRVFLRGKTEKT